MNRRWTFLVLLSIFVQVASCEDVVTGNVSTSSEVDSTNQSMPENIAVNVTINGQHVRLDLKVDRNASTDIPVYVFSRNKDGQLDTQRVNRKTQKHFAVYRDVTHGAVFSGRRDVETGSGHLTLEGVVHVKGKVYDLKSAKRRHRNSTHQTSDGKTGSVGHHVKRRDVNDEEAGEGGHNEAADIHEFVVRPLDDLPPRSLRGDAIVPPIRDEEEKKRKKKKIHYKGAESQESRERAPPPPAAAPPPPPVSEQQSGTHVYIDVAAVADYGVFINWYINSSGLTAEEKTQDVLDKLPEYYSFMFSGVNMLYEGINSPLLSYTLHVKLSAIIIATHRANSLWTETWRVKASPRDEVDSHKALDSFYKWAATSDLLPTYDHLTLFSGYELFSREQYYVINNDVLGVAYTGTMCDTDGKSSSIVEDLSSFESVFVVAHELGHSLSAKHDGDTNMCSADGNNIMAAGFDSSGGSDRHDLWRFSSCSINYFHNYISSTATTVRGHQCLHYSVGPSADIPDVSGQQPGQVYDYDAQCRQIFGPSSSLCRGAGFIRSPSDICMKMYCDGLDDTCYKKIAARGTSCGNKKWCVNGDCVYDSRAPAMDENCPFGDLPGPVWFTNQTCAELIASDPSNCYDNFTFGLCCASCAKYYRPVQNCEYGDRLSGCLKSRCPYADLRYLHTCCWTCGYGTTSRAYSTTTSSTTFTTTSTTYRAPAVRTTTVNSLCQDTSDRVRGRTCPALVAAWPAYCDFSDVFTSCCASCRTQRTGIYDCEYGDTVSGCLKSRCPYADLSYLHSCCWTCGYGTPSRDQSTTTSTTTSTTYRTPAVHSTTVNSLCQDTSDRVRGRTCPALVAAWPAYCDFSDVFTSCCASCRTQRTGIYGLCVDTWDRVQGQTCADLVAASPDSCYDSHVILSCCASCTARNTGVKGCEFGDRDPAQCRILIPGEATCDDRRREECCHTCAYNLIDQTSRAVHSRHLVTSVLIGWIWMIISLLKI